MKALALFSGGLDSMLAIKLLRLQNIEVIALHIDIGFNSKKDQLISLEQRASLAGAPLEIIDVRDTYVQEILFSPKYGYGKQFNPCIDCHGFMFKVAKALLAKYDAQFIVTGEVIGQRPMSQKRDGLMLVKRLAEDEEDDLIVRPLCARILNETKPEKEGWIDRTKLLGLNGRGRSEQLRLAKEYGWEDYPSPAGGCLLTDVQFAQRMRDFIAYDTFALEDVDVLKNGRHFRLPHGAKLVIGRDQRENDFLDGLKNDKFNLLHVNEDMNAPSSLLSKNATDEDIAEACKIILTFTKASPQNSYKIAMLDKQIIATPYANREDAKVFLI